MDWTTKSLGGEYMLFENGLDDYGSWYSDVRYLEHGLDDYGSWYSMYGIGAWTRRQRLLVVYVLYWGTE